jgi:hypothetical protein
LRQCSTSETVWIFIRRGKRLKQKRLQLTSTEVLKFNSTLTELSIKLIKDMTVIQY